MANDALMLELFTAQHAVLEALKDEIAGINAKLDTIAKNFEVRASAHSGEIEAVRVQIQSRTSPRTLVGTVIPRQNGAYRSVGGVIIREPGESQAGQSRPGEAEAEQSGADTDVNTAPARRSPPPRMHRPPR